MIQETFRAYHQKEINRQEAVRLATGVRDVPYVLGADGDIEGLFTAGIGGCARKHFYLMPRLQRLGYKVAIGMSQFDWREFPIPRDILSLLKQPVQHHLFLYFGFNNPENVLDVTWDNGMGPLGFPVFHWDGYTSTGIAVNPTSVRKINPLMLKARSLASSGLRKFTGLNDQPTPFNDAFNFWLAGSRTQIASKVVR